MKEIGAGFVKAWKSIKLTQQLAIIQTLVVLFLSNFFGNFMVKTLMFLVHSFIMYCWGLMEHRGEKNTDD